MFDVLFLLGGLGLLIIGANVLVKGASALAATERRIAVACERVGRDPASVRLLPVSLQPELLPVPDFCGKPVPSAHPVSWKDG